MRFYQDSEYPVRADIEATHALQMDHLGQPGTWGSGVQRIAVALETRKACYEAKTQEDSETETPACDVELPDFIRELIRKLAVSPADFQENSYESARKGGLSDEEYVEIVGIVSRLTDMDTFARGLGVPLRPLPAAKKGQPSKVRPAIAHKDHAWVPTVPNYPEGGEDAEKIYGKEYKPYILRALSLVPEEMHQHIALEEVQYLPMANIMVKDYEHHEGFTRFHSETIAGRISALNECFY